MPRATEDNNVILTYDISLRQKYWVEMSSFIKGKYGSGPFSNKADVIPVLFDVFNYFVEEIKKLINENPSFNFFLYVYWLHEQSIEVYFKKRKGYKLKHANDDEFATYRRILKLILEQGCDYDFNWPPKITGEEVIRFDKRLDGIIYVGRWAYHAADDIAFENMIEDCHNVYFDSDNYLTLDWNHHYGVAYNEIMLKFLRDYETSLADNEIIKEFDQLLKESLKIDFHFSIDQIQQIQKVHSPAGGSDLQTIEPYVLPKNLIASSGTDEVTANLYYDGLIIKRENKLSIGDAIYRPYSTKRYLFKPILVYQIDGVERALVSINKFSESLTVIATNAIQWNTMPEEWLNNASLVNFMNKKGGEHDKILEDEIQQIIRKLQLPFDRNIKSLKRDNEDNIVIKDVPGEIDFIIINSFLKTVFVGEAKYNKTRYEGVGYQSEHNLFLKYETKLKKKVDWVSENIKTVEYHLKEKNNLSQLDISNFEVEGIFLINAPTFYMLNGAFKGVTLSRVEDFLSGVFEYPQLVIDTEDYFAIIHHPYFRKPIYMD